MDCPPLLGFCNTAAVFYLLSFSISLRRTKHTAHAFLARRTPLCEAGRQPYYSLYYLLLLFASIFFPQGFWICKIDEELWCDLDYTNTCMDASAVLSLGEKWLQECVGTNLVIILLEVFFFSSPFLSLFLDFFFHAPSSIRTRFSF